MTLGVTQWAENFLTGWQTIGFSRTLFHGLVMPLCLTRLVSVPTEQDIRVQQQHVFKSLWQSYTCVLLRWQRRRLTSHTRLSHQAIIGQAGRQAPVSLNFVHTKNKPKSLVTYVSTTRRRLQRMAQELMPQLATLWWPLPQGNLSLHLTGGLCVLPHCFTALLLPFGVHSERTTIIISNQIAISRATVLWGH